MKTILAVLSAALSFAGTNEAAAAKLSAQIAGGRLEVIIEGLNGARGYNIEVEVFIAPQEGGKYPPVVANPAANACNNQFFGNCETKYEDSSPEAYKVRLSCSLDLPERNKLAYKHPSGYIRAWVAENDPPGKCSRKRVAIKRFQSGDGLMAVISLIDSGVQQVQASVRML